jgi:hypothetical protein
MKNKTTFGTITHLTHREASEICVMIGAELANELADGAITHEQIRDELSQCASECGNGHTDDFFVDKVVAALVTRK